MVFRFKMYERPKIVLLKFYLGLKPAKRMTGVSVQILVFVIFFPVLRHFTLRIITYISNVILRDLYVVFPSETNLPTVMYFLEDLMCRKQLLLLTVFEWIVSP